MTPMCRRRRVSVWMVVYVCEFKVGLLPMNWYLLTSWLTLSITNLIQIITLFKMGI